MGGAATTMQNEYAGCSKSQGVFSVLAEELLSGYVTPTRATAGHFRPFPYLRLSSCSRLAV